MDILTQVYIKRYIELNIAEVSIPKYVNNGGSKMYGQDTIKRDRQDSYSQDILKACAYRAGAEVKELILQNKLLYHWTLTYDENHLDTGQDRGKIMLDFNRFTQVLRDKVGAYKYLAVLEVQEGRYKRTGNRVWHIHFAVDRFMDIELLSKLWGRGYVFISRHENNQEGLKQVASYLSEYIKKDIQNYHLPGKKRYLCSQGLDRAKRHKPKLTKQELDALRQGSMVNILFTDGDIVEWMRVSDEYLLQVIKDLDLLDLETKLPK